MVYLSFPILRSSEMVRRPMITVDHKILVYLFIYLFIIELVCIVSVHRKKTEESD